MPLQERLDVLPREAHHEQAARVAQSHQKQLHAHRLAGHDDLGLPEVDLGLLTRLEGQWDRDGRSPPQLQPLLTHQTPDRGLPEDDPRVLSQKASVDLVRGMPLLPRLRLIAHQDFPDAILQFGSQGPLWTGLGQTVFRGGPVPLEQGLADGVPRVAEFPGQPLDRPVLLEVQPSNDLVIYHIEHPLSRKPENLKNFH